MIADFFVKYLLKSKISLPIAILLLLLTNTAFSQYGWHQLNSGATNNLHGVKFYSANFGMVVGENGKILRTTNGGLNWFSGTVVSSLAMYKLAYVDSLRWTIVGQNGLILYSSNAGSSWNVNGTAGVSVNLADIQFVKTEGVTSDTGYIAGVNGTLLRTTNGGVTWSQVPVITSNNLYFVHFVGQNTGFVGGYNVAIKTTNAGVNWTTVTPAPNMELSRADFKDSDNGIIVGGTDISNDGVIYRTSNGGANWSEYLTPFEALKSVIYLTNGNISIVGNNGIILMSYTNGNNWEIQTSPVTTFLRDSYFVDTSTAYAVGNSGTIIKTTSAGVIINVHQISSEIPSSFRLYQNYPNPFNPSTNFWFDIPVSGLVSLKIYDSLGREVKTVLNKVLQAGRYEYTYQGENIPSGLYFYTLTANDFSQTMKMILVK